MYFVESYMETMKLGPLKYYPVFAGFLCAYSEVVLALYIQERTESNCKISRSLRTQLD